MVSAGFCSSVHPPETNLHADIRGHYDPTADPDHPFSSQESLGIHLATTFRHSGWEPYRRRVFAALHRTGQTHARCQAFSHCGSHAYILESDDDPPRYRLAGSGCHDRFCLPCGQARASQIARNIIEHAGSKRLRLITLTTGATYPTLSELLDHLYTSFRKLQRTPEWQRHVTGGVAMLELKLSSRTDRWHPHLHCLVEGTYFPQPVLKRAWHRVTGEATIVDIRPAGRGDHIMHYVCKYASKPMDPSYLRIPDRLDQAITALKGRRLCITWGGWRSVLLTHHDDDAGWTNIGEVATYLLSAQAGDADALSILRKLDPAATQATIPHPRPPPPLPPPPAPTPSQQQGLLYPACSLYHWY